MTAYDLTWKTSGIAEEWLSTELQYMAIVHMLVYKTFLFRAQLRTHIYATMTGGEKKGGWWADVYHIPHVFYINTVFSIFSGGACVVTWSW
jgi:hypothetical protein